MARYKHTLADGDPKDVPVRNATTVMIVRDSPSYQVLMVQRTSRVAFGANAWVFPGGRVDAADASDEIESSGAITGLTNAEASEILEVDSDGLAWWIAGVRETVEEAGLLLVNDSPRATTEAIDRVRDAVHEDAAALLPMLAAHGLQADLSQLHEVARFVTPLGPSRRFDTRFFIAAAPSGQSITPDDGEVVAARWVEPGEALEMWKADEFTLMSVTHRMLSCLRRYSSAAEVIERASQRPAKRRVRVNDPDGEYRVLLPEDPGYEGADLEIEHGWVRL